MDASGQLSITHLILNASALVQIVMLFLLGLSVFSWTIIISKSNSYKAARAKADEFEDKFWSGIDLNNLYQECIKKGQDLIGLEVIYSSGFKEFVRLINSGPADQEVVMDGTYRQMKVSQSREMENLESHLATLATIGSISPYIGLFGTVWGIMHAFIALAAVKNATLSMVAPPIAEALIATAMGLFAAIPAVMFYNRFVSKVDALENRYINFMDEFATILNRRLVRVRSEMNQKNAETAMMNAQQNYGVNQNAQQNYGVNQNPQQSYGMNQNAQQGYGANQSGQQNYSMNQNSYSQKSFNHPLGENVQNNGYARPRMNQDRFSLQRQGK